MVPGKLKPGIFGNGKKDDVPKIEDLSINKVVRYVATLLVLYFIE